MSDAPSWDEVWRTRRTDEVSWYQPSPEVALRLIEASTTPASAVIDVGGGASTLVDHLLARGYRDLTVLDLAPAALEAARTRLGPAADQVTWLTGDVTTIELGRRFDLWHDRAVFHFFVDDEARGRYLDTLRGAIAVGGSVVLATFGPDGPDTCSGRPVRRYGRDALCDALGSAFEPLEFVEEAHTTPTGACQPFLYGRFRRTA